MEQKRLLLALVISVVILVAWSYLFPGKPPEPQNTAATPSPTSTSSPSPTATSTPAETQPAAPATVVPQAPRRTVVVRTPLYDATFNSEGAEPVSWIIKRNKHSQSDIYSVAGGKEAKRPLELISPEGLKRQPREVPLQLRTGDAAVDAVLSNSSYEIVGASGESGDSEIVLSGQEEKSLTFLLKDSATGLYVEKAITFQADRYDVQLSVTLKRNDQVTPAKIQIGPSTGDQGIPQYTFYSVAPEAIALVAAEPQRHTAQAINADSNSPDVINLNGAVDWAGVGDTYFAMVAIPAQRTDGLVYRTVQYNHDVNGTKESRFLITAQVPIPTDGSRNVIYAGPKDHYLLTEASQTITGSVGRAIELEYLIDYGWFRWLSRPLAVPILKAINWLKNLTGNYGLAIILFTIVIYSLFFPLKWRSSKAMKKAQKLAPRMKELQEKMKGMKQTDPRLKELQIEQLKLMKEGNPLGGCLPLLIQMPFLFALYRAITISLDFRQASFLWLPDLSAGDRFHILEILMAGTMVVLQLITPAPAADPMQRRMMVFLMPVFMLYVLWGAPSGLLLYWLVGNIVAFSQQFLINHLTRSEDDVAPPTTPTPKAKSKKGAGKAKPSPA